MGHRVTTLNVNTIEPAGNTLTIGASGDTVVLADDVKANTYKDAGGNTLFVSNGSGVLSSVNAGFGDSLKLLSTQTASNSASLSFTSAITGAFTTTYKEYIFKFIDINPATDAVRFHVEFSDDAGTDWETETQKITSSFFYTYNVEAGGSEGLAYHASHDRYTGNYTGGSADIPQPLAFSVGNGADESLAGEMHLFNPSSTTYVKHFYSTVNEYYSTNSSRQIKVSGYVNSTTAQNGVRFRCDSGNFDGKIKMYGVL
jgi:hypothetical protein